MMNSILLFVADTCGKQALVAVACGTVIYLIVAVVIKIFKKND